MGRIAMSSWRIPSLFCRSTECPIFLARSAVTDQKSGSGKDSETPCSAAPPPSSQSLMTMNRRCFQQCPFLFNDSGARWIKYCQQQKVCRSSCSSCTNFTPHPSPPPLRHPHLNYRPIHVLICQVISESRLVRIKVLELCGKNNIAFA